MRKRPRWAFDVPTFLDDTPKAGAYAALLLAGSVGLIIGLVFSEVNVASAELASLLMYGVSGPVFVYSVVALGIVWRKHRMRIAVGRSCGITPLGNDGSAFVDLIGERNSFLG